MDDSKSPNRSQAAPGGPGLAGRAAGNKAARPTGPDFTQTADKLMGTLRSFSLRVMVHLGALAAALGLSSVADGVWQSVLAAAGIYVGLICLAARGTAATPAWLVPAVSGAGLALTLGVLGFPLPQALFWGGAEAWVQRLFIKDLRMGTEWLVLPPLVGVGCFWLPFSPVLPLATAFLAALGLGQAVLRITAFLAARRAAQSTQAERSTASLTVAGGNGQTAAPDPLRVFRASAEDLRAKIPALPYTSQGAVENLAAAAGEIIDCMAVDPRDHDAGARFLKRYLTAAHSVVDTHIRLVREGALSPNTLEAVAAGDKMLVRLGDVFRKEHARLRQNDLTDFSAELRVLDTLLKMDGK